MANELAAARVSHFTEIKQINASLFNLNAAGRPDDFFDSIGRGANFMAGQPDFPSLEQVEKADKEQLAKWYRFLLGTTAEQRKTLRRMKQRFEELGGMTPELSKKIGH